MCSHLEGPEPRLAQPPLPLSPPARAGSPPSAPGPGQRDRGHTETLQLLPSPPQAASLEQPRQKMELPICTRALDPIRAGLGGAGRPQCTQGALFMKASFDYVFAAIKILPSSEHSSGIPELFKGRSTTAGEKEAFNYVGFHARSAVVSSQKKGL